MLLSPVRFTWQNPLCEATLKGQKIKSKQQKRRVIFRHSGAGGIQLWFF